LKFQVSVEKPTFANDDVIEEKEQKVEKKQNKSDKREEYFITRESIFKNLKPSEHRYTFAGKDEL